MTDTLDTLRAHIAELNSRYNQLAAELAQVTAERDQLAAEFAEEIDRACAAADVAAIRITDLESQLRRPS